MPSVTAFQVLEWLRTGTLIVVAVAWFTVGQRQWVRWGIVLLVLEWFAGTALEHGPARALFWLSVLVAGLLVLNFFTLRSWRAPRRIVLFRGAPEGAAAWPSHAAADVETWTKQLAALGFEAPQERLVCVERRGHAATVGACASPGTTPSRSGPHLRQPECPRHGPQPV